MHPGTTTSKGVGRALYSAWQLTPQGCEAGILPSPPHQGKQMLWEKGKEPGSAAAGGPKSAPCSSGREATLTVI